MLGEKKKFFPDKVTFFFLKLFKGMFREGSLTEGSIISWLSNGIRRCDQNALY